MTEDQIVTAMQAALKTEAQTLFSMGRRDAATAIHDYLNECTGQSLIRLHDIITKVSVKA